MKHNKGPVQKLDRDVCIYLAGLFDGEGCFYITYTGKSNLKAAIRLAMNHQETIEWVAAKLGREVKTHGLGRKAEARCKPMYRVELCNFEAITSFIEQVLPFMVTKAAAAKLLLDFCRSRLASIGSEYHASYTEEQLQFHRRLRVINQQGRLETLSH